jgi:hypothetical protein
VQVSSSSLSSSDEIIGDNAGLPSSERVWVRVWGDREDAGEWNESPGRDRGGPWPFIE